MAQPHDIETQTVHDWTVGQSGKIVWRYMSLSRFLWLLQKKQLWLSRADMLGDPWEIALAGEQLDHVIRHQPIVPLGEARRETALERVARIIPAWRAKTFVNCWNLSQHESHALWQIYCGRNEGVAIQSTLGKLHASRGAAELLAVTYGKPGSRRQTPTLIDLVTQKRQMFDYEREIRLVHVVEAGQSETLTAGEFGRCLDWNVEANADFVRVHPLADTSFMDTIRRIVELYAPALADRVIWSEMHEPPPA